MSTYCQIIPDINGQPSKLFQDLMQKINDRDTVKQIYSVATSNGFLNAVGDKLIFDKNGEPTIESLWKFINKKSISNIAVEIAELEESLNNTSGDYVLQQVKTALDFNKKNKRFVALVEDINGRSQITVYERTNNTIELSKKLASAYKVYQTINSLLQNHGVHINILDANLLNGVDGLMSPENLSNTIDGFVGVINIANNYAGFNSVTEEFSHFIVENVKDNPIIQRAERLLNEREGLIESILGDEYDMVVDYYTKQNKPHLIAREALGRLIANMINERVNETATSLFQRAKVVVENFIHNTFGKFTSDDVNTLQNLKSELVGIVDKTINDEIINQQTLNFFRQYGDTLAHTSAQNDAVDRQIQKTRDSILSNLAKYLNVYNPEYERALETTTKMGKQYDDLVTRLQTNNALDGINGFISETLDILQQNYIGLLQLNKKFIDFKTLCNNASMVTQMQNVVKCYSEPLLQVGTLCYEIKQSNAPGSNEYQQADTLSAILGQVQGLIAETKIALNDTRKTLLEQVFAPYFDGDEPLIKLQLRGGKERVVTLSEILDESMGDISWLDRMLSSAQETNDLFIQLVDRFIQNQKEIIRGATLELDHEIVAMDRKYRKLTGKSDTSFMFQFKPGNKKTGYYIAEWDNVAYDEAYEANEAKLKEQFGGDQDKIIAARNEWIKQNTVDYAVESHRKNKKGEPHPPRIYRVPNPALFPSNAIQDLTAAQLEYYKEFMRIREKLCWMLPQYATEPNLAIQMKMQSIGEAIVTSPNGFLSGVYGGFRSFTNKHFRSDFDREEYTGNQSAKPAFFEWIQTKINKNDSDASQLNTFDKTPYKRIPMYFIRKLQANELQDLSLDATTTLREFNIMAQNYSGMHRIVDIIDLIKEQNSARKIKKGNFAKAVNERISRAGFESVMPQEYYTQSTEIFKRVNSLIDMQFYGILKNQGKHLTESLTTAKLCDDLIKYTSFSLLGYNAFSAINNFFNGKYQMFIETSGGEWFNWKDYAKATKQYWTELLPSFVSQYHTPYNNSELALWMELTNTGQNWKSNIRKQKSNRGWFRNLANEFEPGFMLEMGETNIQCVTMLSFLNHTKLYKDPNQKDKDFVSLKDAVKRVPVIKDGIEVDAHLEFKDDYADWYLENGTKLKLKAGSRNMTEISHIIGKLNDEMHGIFNSDNAPEALMYEVGRLALIYRKHIVPQFTKRWKTLGKGMGKYSFVTHQQEEGYYVTALRVAYSLIANKHSLTKDDLREDVINDYISKHPEQSDKILSYSDWRIAYMITKAAMSKHQRGNMKRFRTEVAMMTALMLLSIFVFGGFDDDDNDEWLIRHAYYQAKRLQLEALANVKPLSNGMQVLISPTATLAPLQKFGDIIQNIPNYDKILQSGPYKGHSRLYAATMRFAPIIPQVKDFIYIDQDNHRTNFLQKSFVENLADSFREEE